MIGQVRTICRLVARQSPTRAALVWFLAILSGIAGVLLAVATKLIVDGVVDDRAATAMTGVVLAGLSFGALGMSDRIVVRNLREQLTTKVALDLDTEVLGLLARLPRVDHLDDPDFLDRVGLMQRQGDMVAGGVWGLAELTGLLVEAAAGAVVLAVLVDGRLGLLPLLAVPVLMLVLRAERRVERRLEDSEHLRRASDAFHEQFTRSGSGQEMRLFGSGDELDRRARRYWDEATTRRVRVKLWAQLATLPGWLLLGLGLGAAVLVTADLYLDGSASLGDVVLLWQLATQLRLKVGTGVAAVAALARGTTVAGRLRWLELYAAGEVGIGDAPAAPTSLHDDGEDGLVLEGVAFRYARSGTNAVDNVSVRLRPGSTIAVVGANGAGKTTLVKLLCQLHRPTEGRIRFGDVDLAEMAPGQWRAAISGSFQDFMRFETVAQESVGVGDLSRSGDAEAVCAALGEVGGGDLPERWPQGLDTHLGTTYWTAGVDLSLGEWQKVAGARALMRSSPLLLILDEPTAALDPPAEYAMFRRFADSSASARAKGAIVVLVSHRFSTVRLAELILVMDAGRIVESGTHAELIAQGGLYARMFDLQARAYA